MSVVLTELVDLDHCDLDAEVSATDYDSNEVFIKQGDDEVMLTRRQIQQLSIALDRFMDR
jgi:hypothetical protein